MRTRPSLSRFGFQPGPLGSNAATGHAEIHPLYVAGVLQGVASDCSAQVERFTNADVSLAAIVHWIGLVAHRSQRLDQAMQQAVEQATANPA